ncbi:general secretion pathway protein A [Desulfacinum hydrothermale DSM 13146]|uniref:General secretion pathway protein A n=1 Tax=Desulfacinum hydrothermale DSM 13146 TaxID=1121390 RepID=A0A1W1XSA9_9BACT|nr:AAA family ATPase [Desulfacinum hydrothermale]SMC26735.1 general secretion pathway protein A [Desulfacinum hydrothermale DSM 13146]
MYLNHFKLSTRPFSLTPDPHFLYLSRVHDLALAHLEYALVHQAGFMALTGAIGSGKTTLLKHLFAKVPQDLDVALIFNTHLDGTAFLDMLCREFGLEPASDKKSDLFQALYHHFLDRYAQGRRCLIVVDEAQNLPLETLEELRMLSNLEADAEFLIQIILVGQPEMRRRLTHPSMAQLAQRISVHYHLPPLSADEVSRYVHHRLSVAGRSDPEALFPDSVLERVAAVSGGVPRLINSLCDACLTYAYGEGRDQVSLETVDQVLADQPFLWDRGSDPPEADPAPSDPEARPATTLDAPLDGRALAELALRLESVERRLMALESQGAGESVRLLQEMLTREREENRRLESKILRLKYMVMDLKKEVQKEKEKDAEKDVSDPPPRRRRIFPFGRP